MKDKLFFFIGYQHLYNSDQSTGVSQMNVPIGLTNDRSATGLTAMESHYYTENGAIHPLGSLPSGFVLDPTAEALFQATLPNGQFMIPTAQSTAPYAYGVPNVTLVGTSMLVGDQATAALDYDLTKTDRLSFKYYYQNDPLTKPFGVSSYVGGFPGSTYNGSQGGRHRQYHRHRSTPELGAATGLCPHGNLQLLQPDGHQQLRYRTLLRDHQRGSRRTRAAAILFYYGV